MSDVRPRWGSEVCVVVPAYNEAEVIGEVVLGLRATFDHVVCVDDGSADRTAATARAAGATVLRHPVNIGQGGALATGLAYVRRDPRVEAVITFDADGQHQVADAERMAARVLGGDAHVVLGSRFLSPRAGQVPAARRALLRAATRFTRLTSGLAVTDTHNGLRAFSRSAVELIDIRMTGMAHASEVLAEIGRHGLSWVEEPVDIVYSEYSVAKGQRGLNAFNILCDLAVHQTGLAR